MVKVLKDDIAKHKALFQASENTGQKLIERSQEDPAVVAEVYSKLYKVRTALDKLSARADQRFSRLQHVLLQSQELQVSFDEFLEKLDRLEGSIALQAPVSGVCDTVKEQNQQQQVSFGISAVCTDIMIQKVSLRAQIVLSYAILYNITSTRERALKICFWTWRTCEETLLKLCASRKHNRYLYGPLLQCFARYS